MENHKFSRAGFLVSVRTKHSFPPLERVHKGAAQSGTASIPFTKKGYRASKNTLLDRQVRSRARGTEQLHLVFVGAKEVE